MNPEARQCLLEDPGMAPLLESHGDVELEPAADPFRRLVVSITRQQVSMASGQAIQDRLFEAVEITPSGILAADEATLRDAGLSSAKAEYLTAIAAYFQGLEDGHFNGLEDDAVIEELTGIHGIGPWTAKMFLMFGLGRPDVFPVEDLGIRKAMTEHFGYEERSAMIEHAEIWRPYRSHASLVLWASMD